MFEQTVQTEIRLLPREQSYQGLHCLTFNLHLSDVLLHCKPNCCILSELRYRSRVSQFQVVYGIGRSITRSDVKCIVRQTYGYDQVLTDHNASFMFHM